MFTGKQLNVHREIVKCSQENSEMFTGKNLNVHRKKVKWSQGNTKMFTGKVLMNIFTFDV